MASAPSDPRAVLGRVDRSGRLIGADPALEALQQAAGSRIGQMLALPQIAAVAQLARKLGIPVARTALAAEADHDLELWVRATPEGDEVALAIEGWTIRPATGPRLASLLGGGGETEASLPRFEWATDEEMRVISLSPELAEHLGVDLAEAAGQALTRLVKLEEDEAGEMPLISAVAARRGFTAQRGRGRGQNGKAVRLSGEVVTGADGQFAGFRGLAEIEGSDVPSTGPGRTAAFDLALDEALRSPLDRIIETAQRIVERADGPLRSDYANYGHDIAAAARHLLSVIQSMSEDQGNGRTVNLAALAAEAVVMLDAAAEERGVTIALNADEPLHASGEERAVIQVLVNLIGNAVRHSPAGGTVTLSCVRTQGTASITVSDEGPGIAPADQQRIFERVERANDEAGGTGLGLAISRRLARSLGGDVTLDSAPGQGAQFTLTLPAA
jgi:anti-sigma regulatory factor (Ser/Thr protein kinase)/PAS domain-containing protein